MKPLSCMRAVLRCCVFVACLLALPCMLATSGCCAPVARSLVLPCVVAALHHSVSALPANPGNPSHVSPDSSGVPPVPYRRGITSRTELLSERFSQHL